MEPANNIAIEVTWALHQSICVSVPNSLVSEALKHNRTHPLFQKETCQCSWNHLSVWQKLCISSLNISISVTSQMQNNNFIFSLLKHCSKLMSSSFWSYTMYFIEISRYIYSMNCTCFMEMQCNSTIANFIIF